MCVSCVCDLHVLAELGIVSVFCERQLLPVLLTRSAVSPVLSSELQTHQLRVSLCFCVCLSCMCGLQVPAKQ